MLFHILARGAWEQARAAGTYRPPSLDREGFIHLSREHQLLTTATKWFAGQDDLVVLAIRDDQLRAELRDEPVGDQRFPHLYGPLNLDAVVEVADLPRRPDGGFDAPAAWRRAP